MSLAEVYWPIEKIWPGETVYLLGGGPSLRGFDFDRLRGKRSIAINATGYLAPAADMLFFSDAAFFVRNRPLVEAWAGLVVTISATAKAALPDKVRRIRLDDAEPPAPGCIPGGVSSGHIAVPLAAALGAARIVLLGFDCRIVDGRSHAHDEYSRGEAVYDVFATAWAGYGARCRAAGIDIINATPGSAIDEFRFATLDEIGG